MAGVAAGAKMTRSILTWTPLLLFAGLVYSQQWTCNPTGTTAVTIGERTHLCIIFNNQSSIRVTPIADKMSRVTFNECKA